MKKISFLLLLFVCFTSVSAQDEESNNARKNDFMVDPIILIAVPALNITYERLISRESAIGINAIIGLGSDADNFSQFSPFYRMYFGKKFASGFFVEGFIPITTTNDSYYNYEVVNGNYYEKYIDEKKTTVGFGVAAGGKWVTKRNIIFEASLGIGRRFGLNRDDGYYSGEEVVPRGMLGIGYRF